MPHAPNPEAAKQAAHDARFDALWQQHQGMITRAAFYSIARYGAPLDLMLQAARYELDRCMTTWRPDGGASFLKYFIVCARGLMQRFAERDRGWTQCYHPEWISLDAPSEGEDDAECLADRLLPPVEPHDPFRYEALHQALGSLSAVERSIVRRYYWKGQSTVKIGRVLDLTHARVAQILEEARCRLWRKLTEL